MSTFEKRHWQDDQLQPTLLCDFYKTGHINQYPVGTTKIYSTWTARGTRMPNIQSTVFYGLQGFNQEFLVTYFNDNFFKRPIADILAEYIETIEECLFIPNPDTTHISALHKLGYLPIKIYALPEGTVVPVRVPMFTVENTHDDFFWVTNALETLISTETWQPITVATISREYRLLLEAYGMDTCGNIEHVPFQSHDFSMRGLGGVYHGAKVGGAHLLSGIGSDNIPAIHYLKNHYSGIIKDGGIGCSIPATEHSVQCANMPEDLDETTFIKKLITEVYPTGLISIVFDTNDFWDNVTRILPALRSVIQARPGKVVIRPDSGDPIKILCGDPEADTFWERSGLIKILWDIFGGKPNALGYKVLDPCIGAIYGDAITLERADIILDKLMGAGFASSNIVFGVGSFGYQYVTRDTFAQAFKSTYAVINGVETFLSKDPKTDDGTKKSQKGKVVVGLREGKLYFRDCVDQELFDQVTYKNQMNLVFEDGHITWENELSWMRKRTRQ
jgi:nicotinamide phosphoribosyltransferase